MMNEVVNLINTVGFPIACVLGCSWFIYKTQTEARKDNKEREDKLYETLGEAQTINKELTKTNGEFVQVLNTYKEDLQDIKSDIEIIKDKVL